MPCGSAGTTGLCTDSFGASGPCSQVGGGPSASLFGDLLYDLPGYQNPGKQAMRVYLGCLSSGFQCDANGNYNNPNYLTQANGQYNRLSQNAANVFGSGYTLDATTCKLIGAHCNFSFTCADWTNCGPGRYDDGLHVECADDKSSCAEGSPLVIHDDTVSPWISPWTGQPTSFGTIFGALFTANFWEHGFVDLIGGTYFVGAFPQ